LTRIAKTRRKLCGFAVVCVSARNKDIARNYLIQIKETSMKTILSASLVLLVASLTPFAGQAPNVIGSWDIMIDSPQGQNKAVLVIKKDGDKLSGTLKGARGERPLESISVTGTEITFTMKANIQGQDMIFTYKGKAEKDSMKGNADFGGFAEGTWSAVPHKEDATGPVPAPTTGATNITGTWSFTVETSAGSGSPTFTFKQEGENLAGTYKGQFGEAPLNGTVKGADVKFTIKVNAQGQDLTITYSGKIEGKDSMKGTANYGDLGEGTWTAKRQP
jgi:hypothetical protein